MTSETQADFSDCEVVVEERIVNQRLTGAPIEARTGAAWWEGDRLVHYSACQGAHPTRDLLAKIYGLETSQVRVVVHRAQIDRQSTSELQRIRDIVVRPAGQPR